MDQRNNTLAVNLFASVRVCNKVSRDLKRRGLRRSSHFGSGHWPISGAL